METGPKGKRARNAQFAQIRSDRFLQTRRRAAPSYRRVQAQWGGATLFVLPAFLVLYLCVAILWRPPLWVGALYLGASLLTFVVYAMDKAAAIANRWRTRESTMHWLALVGGWPGALLAQQLLRHKSTKPEFRSAFWGTVVMNVAGFLLFCSPLGRQVRALLQ